MSTPHSRQSCLYSMTQEMLQKTIHPISKQRNLFSQISLVLVLTLGCGNIAPRTSREFFGPTDHRRRRRRRSRKLGVHCVKKNSAAVNANFRRTDATPPDDGYAKKCVSVGYKSVRSHDQDISCSTNVLRSSPESQTK